ncbi:MAG TPA: hypothetical protein ENN54_03245 [Thermoplasmatales archaeon]|nr:hypothetical protein [Thermoplasmatales archaeon]
MCPRRGVRLERLVPLVAACLLLLGTLSTIYVKSFQEQESTEFISLNGTAVSIDHLYATYSEQSLETSADETHTGIPFASLTQEAGIQDPAAHIYRIIAADGYTKEVEWKYLQNSVLTSDKRIIFAQLPKQYWVRDIVEIKVI